MPQATGSARLDEISARWRDLAERRLAYYTELYRSGRWQHYYTRERFAMRMLDVIKAAKTWRELAERTPDTPNLAEPQAAQVDRPRHAA
jgi:uncharacterized repeat protein (TIGR03809 family)